MSASFLASETVQILKHFVRGFHHSRVRLIRPLRENHLHEFLNHIDVGLLHKTLLQASQSFCPAGSADDGISGSGGGKHQVVTNAVQAAGIGKQRKLDISDLRCLRFDPVA